MTHPTSLAPFLKNLPVCYFLSIRLVVLHLILALHPFGPGDVPTHRLIRAGVIVTTEALCNFTWQMQGKHTTMHLLVVPQICGSSRCFHRSNAFTLLAPACG